MNPNAGEGVVAGSQPMTMITAIARSQINFGDLTPYLTHEYSTYISLII
jgi:hypothetical protein